MKLKITSAFLKKIFNFMSINRLLMGGYNDDHIRTNWQRVLFQMYSLGIVATICIGLTFSTVDLPLSFMFLFGIGSEPALLGLFSQFANPCPKDYFFNVLSRCKTLKAKRIVFHVLIYGYFRLYVYPLFVVVSSFIFCWIQQGSVWSCGFVFSGATALNYCGGVLIEIQRVPAILSVGFLYCDMKTLQRTIKKKGVNQEDIVNLYESIYEDFRKVEQATKFQVLIITLNLLPFLVELLRHILTILKGDQVGINLGDVSTFVIFFFAAFNKIVAVCVLEVIYEVQDQIMVYLLDLGVFSTSEPVRAECVRVRSYLRSRRIRLVVGKAVTLGAPLLLTLASLTATYTIAGMQLSHIWS